MRKEISENWEWALLATATFGSMPLVILIATRLRNLAKRARSAHLAEHCLIVGIGTALALAYIFCAIFIQAHADKWGWGNNWGSHGDASLIVVLGIGVCGILFVLWQLYLLVRFAIAFGRAARKMNREWREADRADVAGISDPRGIRAG